MVTTRSQSGGFLPGSSSGEEVGSHTAKGIETLSTISPTDNEELAKPENSKTTPEETKKGEEILSESTTESGSKQASRMGDVAINEPSSKSEPDHANQNAGYKSNRASPNHAANPLFRNLMTSKCSEEENKISATKLSAWEDRVARELGKPFHKIEMEEFEELRRQGFKGKPGEFEASNMTEEEKDRITALPRGVASETDVTSIFAYNSASILVVTLHGTSHYYFRLAGQSRVEVLGIRFSTNVRSAVNAFSLSTHDPTRKSG